MVCEKYPRLILYPDRRTPIWPVLPSMIGSGQMTYVLLWSAWAGRGEMSAMVIATSIAGAAAAAIEMDAGVTIDDLDVGLLLCI